VALACYGQPPEKTLAASHAQAHTTHHNALSDGACDTLIFMVQDFLAGRDALEVESQRAAELVSRHPVFAYGRKRCENPSGFIVETMQAVFQSFFATASFEECLIDVVNRGGDADTTGAILGIVAGALWGLSAIPAHWLHALDPKVVRQCTEQAEGLIGLSPHGRGLCGHCPSLGDSSMPG